MIKSVTISVVVPVYNNENSLPPLFERLESLAVLLQQKNIELEIIFVDDGSMDNSYDVLSGFKSRIMVLKVVKLTKNFGAVNCSRTGITFVTGDAFVILAADLQDPPELILPMADLWLAGSKLTICERESRDDPFVSRMLARFHYFLLRRLVFPNYPKGGFDLALMDKALLNPIIISPKSGAVPFLAFSMGFKPSILKYHRPARMHGKSSWTLAKKMNYFLDIFFGYSIKPIRLLSGTGFIVSTCSFFYGVFVLVNALLHRIAVPGFASLVSLNAFLLGLILVMLGVLGEYLWRVYEQVNNRLAAVVDVYFDNKKD